MFPFNCSHPGFDPCPHGSCWQPSIDIYHCDDEWLVKVDLAGVDPREVEVSARGTRLRIAGQRRDLSVRNGARAYSMEISYNRFERELELPVTAEGAVIDCQSHNGMLLIRIRGGSR